MRPAELTSFDVRVDHRRVRRVVIAVILVLYVVDIPASNLVRTDQGFDFDHPVWRFVLLKSERNIPTAFACLQLGACAVLAVLHALVSRHDRVRGALRWLGMAAVFTYLTLDEGLGIHEGFLDIADRLVPGAGDVMFSWILVALIGAVPVVALYLPWVRRLPGRISRGLLAGGAVYVAGAFGLQIASGGVGFSSPFFPFLAGLEELLELTGIAIFWLTLLQHLVERIDGRPLTVTAAAGSRGGATAARQTSDRAERPGG